MKLKTKLAQDFTLLLDKETIDARSMDARQRATDRAFLAGFDMARELAKELSIKGETCSPYDIGKLGEEEYAGQD